MRAISASLSACAKPGMTTPGMPSSALRPRSTTWIRFAGSGKAQRAVECEVGTDCERRAARVVMTGAAGGRVQAGVRIELLPGAERRVGHRPRHRCTDGRDAAVRVIDIGEISRDRLDVDIGERGKAAHHGRHWSRRGPVQDTRTGAQIVVQLIARPWRGRGIIGGQRRSDPVVDHRAGIGFARLFRAEHVARRVAGTAMAQPQGEIGAAVPFGAPAADRFEASGSEEQKSSSLPARRGC